MNHAKLGARLRQLRQEHGISIRTLASRSGFSPSFISQVEADLVSPSIASLEKIALQLDISLGQLFTSIEYAPRTVVRAADRAPLTSAWPLSLVESLTDTAPDRRLSAVLVTLAPGGASGQRVAPSLQDTCAIVFAGRICFTLDGVDHDLGAGDAVYLCEGEAFVARNAGDAPAALVLVTIAGRSSDLLANRIAIADDAR